MKNKWLMNKCKKLDYFFLNVKDWTKIRKMKKYTKFTFTKERKKQNGNKCI